MASHAAAGAAHLNAGRYHDAIAAYSLALLASPSAPDYYIKRSTAHTRAHPPNHAAALADAELGVVAATRRARRELMAQAQLRRAVALCGLERWADAGFVLGVVRELDPGEKAVGMWEAKVALKLKTVPEGDARGVVGVLRTPEVVLPSEEASKTPATVLAKASAATSIAQTPADKIKLDWYQSVDKVHLTLMAKGIPKDKAVIDIQPLSISVSFPTGSDTEYNLTLDPLFAEINPASSSFSITNFKVEITLSKASSSHWTKLESDHTIAAPVTTKATSPPSTVPSYPTSSKSGPKNWDKLVSDMGDDNDGGDDVNHFFQSLYKGADADTQRAMMKSYQESNGTVLSTNWSEVGKGTVETAPPDGMTARKWGD